MNNNIKNIENNCGLQPLGVEVIDPGNDPSFVFKNDPNFEILTLFDLDGNKVGVNSWTECAHYVNGGWSSVQVVNFQGDKLLFIGVLLISIFSSIYYFLKNKKI
jgi:hypothetical protein